MEAFVQCALKNGIVPSFEALRNFDRGQLQTAWEALKPLMDAKCVGVKRRRGDDIPFTTYFKGLPQDSKRQRVMRKGTSIILDA
jgi:hypothetical protein